MEIFIIFYGYKYQYVWSKASQYDLFILGYTRITIKKNKNKKHRNMF